MTAPNANGGIPTPPSFPILRGSLGFFRDFNCIPLPSVKRIPIKGLDPSRIVTINIKVAGLTSEDIECVKKLFASIPGLRKDEEGKGNGGSTA